MNTNTNTNGTANTANAPAKVSLTAALSHFDIELNMSNTMISRARKAMTDANIAVTNVTDELAVSALYVNNNMAKADEAARAVCRVMGVYRDAEVWKDVADAKGQPFKSEAAFLKAMFPQYATSTLSVYADVGSTVYLPAMRGELPELPGVAELSPSVAKGLVSPLKNAEQRAALPAALKETCKAGRLTAKGIADAAKIVKGKKASKANDKAVTDEQAANIAEELKGNPVRATVQSLIQWDLLGDSEGGDLTAMILERNRKDFLALLEKASKDSATALAVVSAMLEGAKAAK